MSAADEAWQEWAKEKERRFSFEHRERTAFTAGYRRAIETAQKVLAGEDTVEWHIAADERDALRALAEKWRNCDCWDDCHCKDLHAALGDA